MTATCFRPMHDVTSVVAGVGDEKKKKKVGTNWNFLQHGAETFRRRVFQ